MFFKKQPIVHHKIRKLSDPEKIEAAASFDARRGIYPAGMGSESELWSAMCIMLIQLDNRVKELEGDQSTK